MAGKGNNNIKVVPQSKAALQQMKYEIAAELGIAVGPYAMQAMQGLAANTEFAAELGSVTASSANQDYWGYIAARDAGAVGGHITRRLIERAEEALFSLS